MTVVNCQQRETRSEQCSQLCCFEPREGHRPTLMEFLSSKAVTQRITQNESWRDIGMLQNGSIQLNVTRQANASQSVISRSGMSTPTMEQLRHISSLLMLVL